MGFLFGLKVTKTIIFCGDVNMKKLFAAATLAMLSLSFVADDAWAHSGRTDKNGCHMDRKTGTRHCH